MKSKDVNRIIELHDSSIDLVKILTKIINSDRTNIAATTTSYGVLSRLELGLAIKEAGPKYQVSSLLLS